MAASAASAASPAGLSGSVDESGGALEAGEPSAEPIDVNGLPEAALLSALMFRLKGMQATVARRIVAARRERPFDSVADLTRRVNASASSLHDRLGKTYLPFLRVSAPVCQQRVLFSPTGSILGGVQALRSPESRIVRLKRRASPAAVTML